jgi:hypothetical protein
MFMSRPKRISLRFDAELYKALDQKRAKTGEKFQGIGEDLFRQWLQHSPVEMSQPPPGELAGASSSSESVPKNLRPGTLPGTSETVNIRATVQVLIERARGQLEAADAQLRRAQEEITTAGVVAEHGDRPGCDATGVDILSRRVTDIFAEETGDNHSHGDDGDAEARSGLHRKPKAG